MDSSWADGQDGGQSDGVSDIPSHSRQVKSKELFAVKAFKQSALWGSANVQLKREVDTLRALSHPRIVSVHDHCWNEFHLFLVLDLVAERDLCEYINSHDKLDETQGRYVFWQLLVLFPST